MYTNRGVRHGRLPLAAGAAVALLAGGCATQANYEPIPAGRYRATLSPVTDTCGAGSSLSSYTVAVDRGMYTLTSVNTEVLERTADAELVFTGPARENAVDLTTSLMRRMGPCDAKGPVDGTMTIWPSRNGFKGRVEIRAEICGQACASTHLIDARHSP